MAGLPLQEEIPQAEAGETQEEEVEAQEEEEAQEEAQEEQAQVQVQEEAPSYWEPNLETSLETAWTSTTF